MRAGLLLVDAGAGGDGTAILRRAAASAAPRGRLWSHRYRPLVRPAVVRAQ